MRIILDTNIWYDIAEQKYPYKEIKGLHLCLTELNILELILSPKLLLTEKEKEKIFKTCIFIRELNPEYIPYEPYAYIAKEVLEIDNLAMPLGVEVIEAFLNGNFFPDEIEMKKQMRHDYKKSMDEQQKAIREKFNKSILSNDSDNMLSKVLVKAIEETRRILNISDTITMEKIVDWEKNANKISFYLKGREANNILLNSGKPIQAEKNDQDDLLNMVYVGPNDKYWCNDKKWLRKIHWDGIENFLFKLPSQEN